MPLYLSAVLVPRHAHGQIRDRHRLTEWLGMKCGICAIYGISRIQSVPVDLMLITGRKDYMIISRWPPGLLL